MPYKLQREHTNWEITSFTESCCCIALARHMERMEDKVRKLILALPPHVVFCFLTKLVVNIVIQAYEGEEGLQLVCFVLLSLSMWLG